MTGKGLPGLLATAACVAAALSACKSKSSSGAGPIGGAGAGNCLTTPAALRLADAAATTTQIATWVEVKPILQKSCMGSCHQHDAWSTYAEAKNHGAAMVQNTDKDPSEADFMPEGGQKLSFADRQTLVLWVGSGMPLGLSQEEVDNGSGTAALPLPETPTDGIVDAANDRGTPDGASRFQSTDAAVPEAAKTGGCG